MGDRRPAELANVPTMAESGYPDPEYRPTGGAVLLGPAHLPPAILSRLEREARAAVQTPEMKARLQIYGMYAQGTTSAEFRRDFDVMLPVMERLIRQSGARVE